MGLGVAGDKLQRIIKGVMSNEQCRLIYIVHFSYCYTNYNGISLVDENRMEKVRVGIALKIHTWVSNFPVE